MLAEPWRDIDVRTAQVDGVRDRARRALRGHLDRAADQVGHLRASVHALSPAATLDRGYAVVQSADGTVLRDASETAPDEALRVRLAAGDLDARVTGVRSA